MAFVISALEAVFCADLVGSVSVVGTTAKVAFINVSQAKIEAIKLLPAVCIAGSFAIKSGPGVQIPPLVVQSD